MVLWKCTIILLVFAAIFSFGCRKLGVGWVRRMGPKKKKKKEIQYFLSVQKLDLTPTLTLQNHYTAVESKYLKSSIFYHFPWIKVKLLNIAHVVFSNLSLLIPFIMTLVTFFFAIYVNMFRTL